MDELAYGELVFKQKIVGFTRGISTVNIFKNIKVGDAFEFRLSLRNSYCTITNLQTNEAKSNHIKKLNKSIDLFRWGEM